jgi:hypothetical protein
MSVLLRKRCLQAVGVGIALVFLVVSTGPSIAATSTSITFKNTYYGFSFNLPSTWKNYYAVNTKWLGYSANSVHAVTSGPVISLRHPLWTATKPRQDIPIMIFTSHQWNALTKENFHIGAAPIPPSELGHNSTYVFALPARYNYAFLPGYTEVAKILASKPLKTFEKVASAKL